LNEGDVPAVGGWSDSEQSATATATATAATAAPAGESANDADGFSYRVTMNGLPSADAPVTISLPPRVVLTGAGGGGGVTQGVHYGQTVRGGAGAGAGAGAGSGGHDIRRRRRLAEQLTPHSTGALTLSVASTVALPAASLSLPFTPVCAELTLAGTSPSFNQCSTGRLN
jgi:hypothetical protein